jgi:hypothetical protein
VISTEARVAFLRRIHLFQDLTDEDLAVIADTLLEETLKAEEVAIKQGAVADRLFIIYQGGVRVTQIERKEKRDLAFLIGGDYFGEEELLTKQKRTATVTATEKTDVFVLTQVTFRALLKRYPKLKTALEVAVESRRLARRLHFDWLRQDEVIYFLARKHEILLAQALSGPLLAATVPIFLLVYFFLTLSFFAIFGAGILFVGIAGWAVWQWIDWGNDYYIVTNQRVIWLEKVIGIYDSRQEAPLGTVLSVGVETDVTGRLLDYGNVIVRTYVGMIPFSHVSHPYEASHLVEEQWTRTKHSTTRMEKEAMRNVLRQKMGLTVQTKKDETEKPDLEAAPTLYRRSIFKKISSNWFKLRIEDSGTITYRKHWFVLWQQIWQPTVLILLIGIGLIVHILTRGFKLDTVVLSLPVVLLPLMIWWAYQYMDWRNDIFQVTPDQILDIDKKPFGSEERRAAPLENILSTESSRVGLTGYLLNFGTVYITVGGAHLDFEDVLDPTSVQADIDRRREARIKQKRDAEASAERERMSDWLVAYHENESELQQQKSPSEEKKPEK